MPDRFGELSVSAQAAADILTEDRYLSSEALYYDRSTNTARSSLLSYVEKNAKELWDASSFSICSCNRRIRPGNALLRVFSGFL